MSMSPEAFFELFLKELVHRPEVYGYYKFLTDDKSFEFRKNYFLERLRYIAKQIDFNNKNQKIWDCGSGYGTTCLFLAMNGISSHGTTLEFYYETVQERYQYWNQFGNANLFTCSYENLFDSPPPANTYDCIIVQDTLHHLEPIDEALQILHTSLTPQGKIIAVEENGDNIIQSLKLYRQRGNKRIIQIYDEKLKKHITIGNENIRGLAKWEKLLNQNQLKIDHSGIQYVRYYLPFYYTGKDAAKILEQEKALQIKSSFRKKYFFFGLNFVAYKK